MKKALILKGFKAKTVSKRFSSWKDEKVIYKKCRKKSNSSEDITVMWTCKSIGSWICTD